MLEIDDLKKLAKMLETLLKRTKDNKEINLDKYKNIVRQIDDDSFEKLLTLLKQFKYHNLTFEEELEFLEQVSSSYQQLLEQQCNFKNVYELYGNDELELSDLGQININYINDRISNISGYLINKKNIEINENKLKELNDRLIEEEKNKNNLSKRLLEYEEILRNSFISAEGRCIDNGKLQYISVISEYNELGLDFRDLLYNEDELNKMLSLINDEKNETSEKLKIVEICYNNAPSVDSKQILDDVKIEDLKVKYKLTLLKIIDLLLKNCDNYEDFKIKREQLLDLIKYRLSCIAQLGMSISIDPFSRTKISEQLEVLSTLKDNLKEINKIKKEMAILDQRLEEMFVLDRDFAINIDKKSDLILSNVGINDIDVSSAVLPVEDEIVEKIVDKNQVVDVKDIPIQFNSSIVEQKAKCVIERVNEMVNNSLVNEEKIEISSPELVIVPSHDVLYDDNGLEDNNNISNSDDLDGNEVDDFSINPLFTTNDDIVDDSIIIENLDNGGKILDEDMFKNVDPFLDTPLFTDRTDDSNEVVNDNILVNEDEDINSDSEIDKIEELENNNNFSEDMPDAFWITQSEGNESLVDNSDEFLLSFDEQIDALLSDDEDNSKTRKMR